jgi:hypothetical protein
VILCNRGASTRTHDDVQVRHRRLGNSEHSITKSLLRRERRRQRRATFCDVALNCFLRQPLHSIRWTAQHRESREVGHQRSFKTKVAITAHPWPADSHGQGQGRIIDEHRACGATFRRQRRGLNKRRGKKRFRDRCSGPWRRGVFTRLLPRTRTIATRNQERRHEQQCDDRARSSEHLASHDDR